MARLGSIANLRTQPASCFNSSVRPKSVRHSLFLEIRRSSSWWSWTYGTQEDSCKPDDSFQRHLLRTQRSLKYKHLKASRRRESWERSEDPSGNSSKPTWQCQTLKASRKDSTDASSSWASKASDQYYLFGPKATEPTAADDLSRFKKWIDEDPFAAAFGDCLPKSQAQRRGILSPSSSASDSTSVESGYRSTGRSRCTHASPTSISDLDNNAGQCLSPESRTSGPPDMSAPLASPPKAGSKRCGQSDGVGEYQFDPISMRNVLIAPPATDTPTKTSKPLLDPSFPVDSVDVPVKTYKPRPRSGKPRAPESERHRSPKGVFDPEFAGSQSESSRLTEFRRLRAASLGNSIDTAGQYHGRWIPADEKVGEVQEEESATEPAGISREILDFPQSSKSRIDRPPTKSLGGDWLSQEGFLMKQKSPSKSLDEPADERVRTERHDHPVKLQPSLDRFDSDRGKTETLIAARNAVLPFTEELKSDYQSQMAVSGNTTEHLEQAGKTILAPERISRPSQRVVDAEQVKSSRTLPLGKASMEKQPRVVSSREQETSLGQELKAIYEDEYGPITTTNVETSETTRSKHWMKRVKNLILITNDAMHDTRQVQKEVTREIEEIQHRLKSEKTSIAQPESKVGYRSSSCLEATSPLELESEIGRSRIPTTCHSLQPESPSLYKVLAYDSSTLQMTIAETSSSMPAPEDGQPAHPAEVLTRLNSVSKFLPYFAQMGKEGYEIISGSGDVLVFKKTRVLARPTPNVPSPLKDATTISLPTAQAPTSTTLTSPLASTNPKSPKIRRQETVFSGSPQSWHRQPAASETVQDESGSMTRGERKLGWIRMTIRNVLVAASVTAAVAYTVGVVLEPTSVSDGGSDPRRRPGVYSMKDARRA